MVISVSLVTIYHHTKVLPVFLMMYFISLCIIYFITGSLYLVIPSSISATFPTHLAPLW